MHEVWKRKQIHEDVWVGVLDQNFCQKVWENGEDAIWEDMTSSERMDRKGRSLYLVPKMLGVCEAKKGPKLITCCIPEPMGTKEIGKMVKRIQILEEGRVPAKEAKNWRID